MQERSNRTTPTEPSPQTRTTAIPDAIQQADTALTTCNQFLDLYSAITPTNWQAERTAFLNRRRQQPRFTYEIGEHQRRRIAQIREQLEDARTALDDCEQTTLVDLYQGTVADHITQTRIIQHLTDRSVVPSAAQDIWGTPDRDMVQYAERIVEHDEALLEGLPGETRSTTTAETLRASIDHLIDVFNLDWDTAYTDAVTHVTPVQQRIHVHGANGADTTITGDHDRILLHEFGVHAFRAANGQRQPYALFRCGTSGYETTEEGLTAYLEYTNGLMNESLLRQYALRVLAVDSMIRGEPFKDAFNRLLAYSTPEQAFYNTMRAYRAGGITKDYVYLAGFKQILEHMQDTDTPENDLQDLYAGKIALDNLEDVRQLQRQDQLVTSTYTPELLYPHLERIDRDDNTPESGDHSAGTAQKLNQHT